MSERKVRGLYVQPASTWLGEGIEKARRHAAMSAGEMAKVDGRVIVGEPAMYHVTGDLPGLRLGSDVVCLAFEWDTEPTS